MSENVATRLMERATRHPERVALIETRRGRTHRVTFGELARRVEGAAAAMIADGVGPGDRVLLLVPMSADLYSILLGALHAGAVAVFLDAWADRARVEWAVRLAAPRLFVAPPLFHLLRLATPSLRRIPRHRFPGTIRSTRPVRTPEPSRPPVTRNGSDPALITFTTGSTGTPKAAIRTHGLLWAQHQALAAHLILAQSDVDMPTLPIFVLNNLALGVTTVLPDFDPRRPAQIRPGRIMDQMREYGVTTTSGSPAFYDRLAAWCEARGEHLQVRLWTGGAPVYPPLARALERMTEGRAHVVYGSTEAEPIAGIAAAAMLRAGDEEGAEGLCCGVPVPEIELRIVRPVDGPVVLGREGWGELEVAPGDAGEIIVAGPHVVGEYLHAPEETRRHKIRDGNRVWHRTGDAGRVDGRGRLWLMGRVSARVQRDGETWWSTPAEIRALGVDGVRHAAYLGGPDRVLGQRAVLCLEAEPTPDLEPRVRRALSGIPVDELRVLASIPRDPRHASKTDVDRLRRVLDLSG